MEKPCVLFLCTANSSRSQMAEGFLRYLASYRFEAASAGARPTRLNPDAVRVMQEHGIDISSQRSKGVEEFWDQRVNYLITVCDKARESCPVSLELSRSCTGAWKIRPRLRNRNRAPGCFPPGPGRNRRAYP